MSEHKPLITKRTVEEAGECQFCNRPHNVVYLVIATHTDLAVRFCARCRNQIEKAKFL